MIKTKLKRYYRWRFSGPITVIGAVALAILSWHFITDEIEFYDKFTCPQIMEYRAGDYGISGEPKYSQLTDLQKQKFDSSFIECVDLGWNPKEN